MINLRSLCVVSLAAMAISLVAVSAQAQPGGRGPGGPGGPGMMGPGGGDTTLMLLRSDKVQKELELVDDQKQKIQEVLEKSGQQMREAFSGLQDLSQEERRERMAEMRKKMEQQNEQTRKQINEILLPHQTERLREIRIQLAGAAALRDPEVAKALELTDAQKEQLDAVQAEARKQMQGSFQNMRDLSDEERQKAMTDMREKMRKMNEQTDQKTLAVLTAAQKDKLEELKGKKIDFTMADLMPRGGPGQRGPGAPGGRQRPNRQQ